MELWRTLVEHFAGLEGGQACQLHGTVTLNLECIC